MIPVNIDSDMMVYQLAWTVDPDTTRQSFIWRVGDRVDDILMAAPGDAFARLLLTDNSNNFRNRYAVTVPYKGNRVDLEKPFHYDMVRDVMVKHFGAHIETEQEADDAVVIATEREGGIVASGDKDLLGYPGAHIRLIPQQKPKYIEVDVVEALRHFYTQMLTGDSGDNIIGIYRMGPKTAAKVLDGADTESVMFDRVFEAYREYYASMAVVDIDKLVQQRLEENGILLHMRRFEGELWLPPNRRPEL